MKTATILIAYTLLLIGGLTALAIYMPKPTEVNKYKNFNGIDAAGFKHGGGETTTIINH